MGHVALRKQVRNCGVSVKKDAQARAILHTAMGHMALREQGRKCGVSLSKEAAQPNGTAIVRN